MGVTFLLGFAPVFVVRLTACLYPRTHDRRRELVAEMEHVKSLSKTPEMWRWLGEIVATAVWEAPKARYEARYTARRTPREQTAWVDEWAPLAACRTAVQPDAMFVRGGKQNKAKQICVGCPVRAECLAEALDNQIDWGVWGGMTERERRALLRREPSTTWRSVLEAAQARTSLANEAPRPDGIRGRLHPRNW
ncbi:WhiB-related protein [Nocardioidaceae bacterium Broad-1]|nr:WhiB-related protein [Nocardioidaceae bacterium Broad-1]